MIEFNNNISDIENIWDRFAYNVSTALSAKAKALADAVAQKIRNEKLSGALLVEKTGLLKNSITSSVEENDGGVLASIYVDGDVPYAAIQEYGGRTKAHVIEAIRGKALAFGHDGKQSFFARVDHPGSILPERSYLHSTLDEMHDNIITEFGSALEKA